jgi:hypothetical protein
VVAGPGLVRVWPDQELDRRRCCAGVPITVLPFPPGPRTGYVPAGKEDERMTNLQQIAGVVIGVGTHGHTHSAAVGDRRRRRLAGLDRLRRPPQRAAGLGGRRHRRTRRRAGRLLAGRGELVLELDRPERGKRCNGAKSGPLDAIRAAREASSRAKLGPPGRREPAGPVGAADHPPVGRAGRHRRPAAAIQPGGCCP